jgi:hypothetical protein
VYISEIVTTAKLHNQTHLKIDQQYVKHKHTHTHNVAGTEHRQLNYEEASQNSLERYTDLIATFLLRGLEE